MTRIERIYQDLLAHFGPQHWWPVQGGNGGEAAAWEVAVGAILTQNTNWQNVERALGQVIAAGKLNVHEILTIADDELAQLIRPAGYFNVKTKRLKALANWWQQNYGRGDDPDTPTEKLRKSLLGVHGVGPETADSILLYAFGRPSFVVDTYTRRILTRHSLIDSSATYDQIKNLFESSLPCDEALYNEYHALIVAAGKHHCKPTQNCTTCPLARHL